MATTSNERVSEAGDGQTAMVQLLASDDDGESRGAVTNEITSQPAMTATRRPEPKFAHYNATGSVGSEIEVSSDFAGSGEFGADVPMGGISDRGRHRANRSGYIPVGELPNDATTAAALAAGYSAQALAEMSAAEREQLVKGLKEAGLLDQGIRESQTADLLAASHARSGGGGGSPIEGI